MNCPECGATASIDEGNTDEQITSYECLECGEQFDETDERLS